MSPETEALSDQVPFSSTLAAIGGLWVAVAGFEVVRAQFGQDEAPLLDRLLEIVRLGVEYGWPVLFLVGLLAAVGRAWPTRSDGGKPGRVELFGGGVVLLGAWMLSDFLQESTGAPWTWVMAFIFFAGWVGARSWDLILPRRTVSGDVVKPGSP